MRITGKGQVTIPQHIRQAAGLRPNDEVEFEYRDGVIILRAADGMSCGERLLTCDVARYRSYFPGLLRVSWRHWPEEF